MTILPAFLSCGLLFSASAAAAHPHVFIDTGLEVIFDADGRAEAVRVTWSYDDFYSLTLITERGLDPDFDGVLTPEETTALSGFDMAWDAGFPGDTYALMAGQSLALSGPSDWTATYQDGVITSTHLRRFDSPVAIADQPLVLQVYDPSYYTAYRIGSTPVLTNAPAGCSEKVFRPDPNKVDATLMAALAEYSASEDVTGDFPAVGAKFAEEARITCADPF